MEKISEVLIESTGQTVKLEGEKGTTFTPSVDANGNLSWTNDGGKQNPTTVNIKGERGEKGDTTVIDPSTATTYTLYNQTGNHTDGAMTQDAATMEIDRLNTLINELQRIVATIGDTVEGYVRVAGSSSPALSYKHYKKDGGDFGAQSVFNIFYPCLVGTPLTGSGTEGKILHVLDKFGAQNDNGVAKWADLEGVLHNIDGSEGDVIICNTIPYHRIMGKRTVNNVVYDVFLMSVQPFSWQGHESEKVEKCGHR